MNLQYMLVIAISVEAINAISSDFCPGLHSACGPDIHYPFDDVTNFNEVCGNTQPLSIFQQRTKNQQKKVFEFYSIINSLPSFSDESTIERVNGISGSALYLTGNEKKPLYSEIDDISCSKNEDLCPFGYTVAFWIKPISEDALNDENDILFNVHGRYKRGASRRFATQYQQKVYLALLYGEGGRAGELVVKSKFRRRRRRVKENIYVSMKYPQTIGRKRGALKQFGVRHQIKLQKSLIPNDKWNHVVIRWDIRQSKYERLSIFVNQKQVYGKIDLSRKPAVGATNARGKSTSTMLRMFIGGTELGDINNGIARMAMDELQIWKKPLDDDTIKFLQIHPGCPPCWLQYDGRCFKHFEGESSFEEASSICSKNFAALMTDEKPPAYHFVLGHYFLQRDVQNIWVRSNFDSADFLENVNLLFETGGYDNDAGITAPDSYLPRDDPNVPTLDFSDDFPSQVLPYRDYALDDFSVEPYSNFTYEPQICNINSLQPPRFNEISSVDCGSMQSVICQIDINECAMSTHKCGRYKCIDQPSGYTCACPRGLKWNGEICQGTRTRNDYCNIMASFSALMPNKFCKHKHFQILCPNHCT